MTADHPLPRPIDLDAALARAAQIAAAADPDRLQVLSVIATRASADCVLDEVASVLGFAPTRVAAIVDVLESAGLVARNGHGRISLTADAWMRFGRIVGSVQAAPQLRPVDAPPSKLPSAVGRVARDLEYRYLSVFSAETVHRYVAECYDLLASRATITTFLPTLTARFATDRLSALATAKGLVLHSTPEVLFVCVQNAGRSQLASAILRHLAGARVHVRTAGSRPARRVDPIVIESLAEIGIRVADEFPKPLTSEVVQASDFVITMGCGDACPVYPGRRYMDWALADPTGKSREAVRGIRDEVYARVESLVSELRFSDPSPAFSR